MSEECYMACQSIQKANHVNLNCSFQLVGGRLIHVTRDLSIKRLTFKYLKRSRFFQVGHHGEQLP